MKFVIHYSEEISKQRLFDFFFEMSFILYTLAKVKNVLLKLDGIFKKFPNGFQ